jgi:hypothetical protein
MQDKKVRRTVMFQMISDWQQCGLSQKDYCVANNIAYHVFHYWYGVYRSGQNDTEGFVPVNVTSPTNDNQIVLTGVSGIRLQLPFSDHAVVFIKQLLLS